MRNEIAQSRLHELFDYKDGQLLWKVSTKHSKVKIGDVAGNDNGRYIRVRIDKKTYTLHRLIFCYHHGYCPEIVDHIDNNKSNNNICNLREATKPQNMFNSKLSITSTTKVKNVVYVKANNNYRVMLRIDGKKKSFGCYRDLELADLVASEARDKFHGRFARHG